MCLQTPCTHTSTGLLTMDTYRPTRPVTMRSTCVLAREYHVSPDMRWVSRLRVLAGNRHRPECRTALESSSYRRVTRRDKSGAGGGDEGEDSVR